MRAAILLLLAAVGLSAQTSIFPAPQTGGSGTVTSVGATVPSWLSLTGSPITSTGTLAIAGATGQTANLILGTDGSGNVGLMNLAAVQLPANQTIRQIGMNFDGGGSALSTSITRCTHVDYSGTIQAVTLKADQAGNATVDVKTVAYASYTGPASATSIAASAIPVIASAVKYQDTTLTGWSKSLAANTEVCFALTSPATITWAQITLKVAAN